MSSTRARQVPGSAIALHAHGQRDDGTDRLVRIERGVGVLEHGLHQRGDLAPRQRAAPAAHPCGSRRWTAPAARAACAPAWSCRNPTRRRAPAPRLAGCERLTSSTALSAALGAQHAGRHLEGARDVSGFQQGRPVRRCAERVSARLMMRPRPPFARRRRRSPRGGCSARGADRRRLARARSADCRQASIACGQRPAKVQPCILPISEGTMPGMVPSRSPRRVRPGTGMQANRPRV